MKIRTELDNLDVEGIFNFSDRVNRDLLNAFLLWTVITFEHFTEKVDCSHSRRYTKEEKGYVYFLT